MGKEFVPYKIALELKELGFDEECSAWYNMSQNRLCFFGNDCCADMYAGEELRPEAPLWQQAFDWFREKYNFNSWISGRKSMGYGYTINNVPNKFKNNILDTLESPHIYESYEKARQACLEKLIELAKEKNVK